MREGILFGLLAAVLQSAGYMASRLAVRQGARPAALVAAAQGWMGLAGVFLTGLFPPHGSGREILFPLVCCTLGTLGGQFFFFRASAVIAPSRLTSLMGLRVAVLCIVLLLLGVECYHFTQYCGVMLAVLSCWIMNWEPGGGFRREGMRDVLAALFCYALSDLHVLPLLGSLDGGISGACAAAGMVYIAAALFTLPLWLVLRITREEAFAAIPYCSVWLPKQIFLYACYGLIGPVFGNVVMAARGPVAILLTLLALHFGVTELESAKPRRVWLQRGAATLVMAAGIIIYSL